ncbi:RDD family protein [Candidatus Mesenet endosymbiont of Agriotes lineatus]|uniref:RDD family protein n=1 Tax=Candidatus Mesenet endosymbiont of Agriotes lineatus TaxID=3077948 RepID=UPI0030D3C304
MNDLNVEVATIQRRFAAYLIDTAILLFPSCILLIVFEKFPVIFNVIHMSLNCLYYTYFISSANQATVGQQIMNIYVANLDKTKIKVELALDRSLSQCFLPLIVMILYKLSNIVESHTILHFLSILEVMILMLNTAWYLAAVFSSNKQTVHDILFKTIVVVKTKI